MKTNLLISVLLGLTIQSFCQKQGQEKIDSLFDDLKAAKPDTLKVNLLNALSYEFRSDDPDTSIYLATLALTLATRTNYKWGIANAYLSEGAAFIYLGKYKDALKNNTDALKICDDLLSTQRDTTPVLKLKARAYNNIGNVYDNLGDYSEALKNHFAALTIREETGDKTGIAASYNNIGNIYVAQGNYAGGLKYHFAALRLKEATGDQKGIANSYTNIGNIYYSQNDYSQSLKYYLSALKIMQEIGDKGGVATCYNNIGIIYDDERNDSLALKYHLAALQIQEETGDQQSIALSYENIGLIHMHRNDYRKALEYFFLYLKTSNEIEDKSGIADACINIGKIYLQQKKNKNASVYLDKGLLVAREIGNPAFIEAAYEGITKLDSAQGDFKKAFEDYKLYIFYRDSLFNENNTKKLVQSQMQYEFDKKESLAKAEQEKKDAQARRIKNQQYFTIATLGIIVLAVGIVALIQYRNNAQKKKANALLQQQKTKVESTLKDLKATQAQLIHSEKMASLGQLTAGVAHEIQNPLNFVNNFSELNEELLGELLDQVDKGNADEAKALVKNIKQNLEKINHHGKRADAIVKSMLQHSRKSTGQKEPTDINALCDEYLRLSYHGMRAKDKTFNATLQTDFDETIEKINLVPQDMGRVLLNLYNNAFYAVMQKQKDLTGSSNLPGHQPYVPTVAVVTRKVTRAVEIRVSDNGNGIPKDVVDKIFQPFFTTKPTGEGTGLGLSLSYDIIKAHGGEIQVESKLGKGAAFLISIPIIP